MLLLNNDAITSLQWNCQFSRRKARSINSISTNASRRDPPQVSLFGAKLEQIDGLSGFPKNPHRLFSVRLTYLTPAGLPLGMPGMADESRGRCSRRRSSFDKSWFGSIGVNGLVIQGNKRKTKATTRMLLLEGSGKVEVLGV
jgi:hypothetical protein